MNFSAYLHFDGRSEYIADSQGEPHCYPLGSLVFGTLDFDWRIWLEKGRALQSRFTDVAFEPVEMKARLAKPERCPYYKTAQFYSEMSAAIRTAAPALFDLWQEYCATFMRENVEKLEYYTRELDKVNRHEPTDTNLTVNQISNKVADYGNAVFTGEIMLNYCHSFPAIPQNMQWYIDRGTKDHSLCYDSLQVLAYFVRALDDLTVLANDLQVLIRATLCGADGKPLAHPAQNLIALEESDDSLYKKYSKHEQNIRIKTKRFLPQGSKKDSIAAATFYASHDLPALIFLEFVQMCTVELPVARCANCGRLFVPFSKKARYCDRVADQATGGTCKQIAAKRRYFTESKENPARSL